MNNFLFIIQHCFQNYNFYSGSSINEIPEKKFIFFNEENYYNNNIQTLLYDSNQQDKKEFTHSFLSLYNTFSTSLCKHLKGNFCFIFHDQQKNIVFSATDHLGIYPVYYFYDKEHLYISNNVRELAINAGIVQDINPYWIYDTIAGIHSPIEECYYRGVKKLLPGHYLLMEDGKLFIKKYWSLDENIVESGNTNTKELISGFRQKLEQAVVNSLGNSSYAAAELSGGLDSSLIASIGYDKKGLDFYTFSYTLSHAEKSNPSYPFKDETAFIQEFLSFKKTGNHFFCSSEKQHFLETTSFFNSLLGYPVQDMFPFYSKVFAPMLQEKNIEMLLSGFGGDQFVSSQYRIFFDELVREQGFAQARQQLFLFLKNHHPEEVTKSMMLFYLKHHYRGLYDFYKKWKRNKYNPEIFYSNIPLSEDILGDKNFKERFFELKIEKPLDDYHAFINNRLNSSYINRRLESYYGMAAIQGIKVGFPLLDRELLEYYMALPMNLKMADGWGRYAFRMASEGLVPQSIQWRKDKTTAIIPSLHSMLLNNYENIEMLIENAVYNNALKTIIDIRKMRNMSGQLQQKNFYRDKNSYPGLFYKSLAVMDFIMKSK